jgi:hypothetical protein
MPRLEVQFAAPPLKIERWCPVSAQISFQAVSIASRTSDSDNTGAASYGQNPWNSMLTFSVDAGPVRNKAYLLGFFDILLS